MLALRQRRTVLDSLLLALCCAAILSAGVMSARTEESARRSATVVSLDGPSWLLAPDLKNIGREQKWWEKPVAEAKEANVPCTIEEVFPGCHGVAWYWREFTAPANPHPQGRYLLRFWGVDYLADVWVNGVHMGQHEGANDPFVLDATAAVRPQAVNRIAVRVLNPMSTPIDGIRLPETAHTSKSDGGLNWGGIMDSVELIVSPAVRIEDVFVRPDPKTGQIRIRANLRNAGPQAVRGRVVLTVSPAKGGETLDAAQLDRELPPGDTLVETELKVDHPRLWELNDPYLYRVTVRVRPIGAIPSTNNPPVRIPRFPLPRRLLPAQWPTNLSEMHHTGGDTPVGITASRDPELPRKDLINCKAMGLNMIRFITGLSHRFQFDLCDEIGMLVYQENYASWQMQPSPKLAERFNRATLAMVRRDRNHPSVVMWGILNETVKDAIFDHAVTVLPLVRTMDDTRMVMLNSGGFDGSGKTFANPGSNRWERQPLRSASLPTVAAQRPRHPFAAHARSWPPNRSSSRNMASAAPGPCGPLGISSSWARRPAGRRLLPRVARPVHGRLAAVEYGRYVRQPRGLLPSMPGMDGRLAEAGHQRHSRQSKYHRLQSDRPKTRS